jgi:hypothetical protein
MAESWPLTETLASRKGIVGTAEIAEGSAVMRTETKFVPDSVVEEKTAIPAKTLANWRVEGKGPPFYKFGAAVRYNLEEVYDWAAAQRRLSTTEDRSLPVPPRPGRAA